MALPVVVASCLLSFSATAGPAILYNFSRLASAPFAPGTNIDGSAPGAKMVYGYDHALYGTTRHGGANGAGSIFRLTPGGSLSTLYSFSAATNATYQAVAFDLQPNDLVQGADGNFYGTTHSGGSSFNGTIFVVSPSGSFTNLGTFGSAITNSSGRATVLDGSTPVGALVQAGDGNFYGVTEYGGSNGTGTIFRLTPPNSFSSLYSFPAAPPGTITTNGTIPNPLLLAADGSFYGTTRQGGFANAGTFFNFTLAGRFTQLYSFDGQAQSNNPVVPNSTLVQGLDGSFYGTSAYGGSQAGGTIFRITTAGNVTLLHSFPLSDAGADAALTLGVNGDFYGTAGADGLNGNGEIFRVTPQGDYGSYHFSPLDANSDNPDGANPSAALTFDGVTNFYGTCAAGGTNGAGVIFELYSSNFIPPYLSAVPGPPVVATNTLVGSSVTLTNFPGGLAPLSLQWLHDGTNLAVSLDAGSTTTNTLTINPVHPIDVGTYALRVSNIWGAVTSSVTALTVVPPGVFITSPLPDASISTPAFSGTATNAPLFSNTSPSIAVLTNVLYSISNILYGSNVAGGSIITSGGNGASNWFFTAAPFPGTNILTVQSVDASGNISPPVSRTFFFAVPTRLTVLTGGSGTGTFSFTNGSELNVGEGYSISANPNSSIFSNWNIAGAISYNPTASFLMQSNLVATAYFLARQTPVVAITSPVANVRTNAPVLAGTATPSPLLPGVNPANLRITNVIYRITNFATGTIQSGSATLRGGGSVSNWSIATNLLGGTNTLAVQCLDISGGQSPIVSQTFFYKVPAVFTLGKAGNGNGTFTSTAALAGDAVPTNGARLNIGEGYTVTAMPDSASVFSNWLDSDSVTTTAATRSFIMKSGYSLTARFTAIPPTVAITSPAANQRTTAPVFSGTASGHHRIANVTYSIVNNITGATTNGSAVLAAGSGSVSNWTFALVPPPGTDTLTVNCQDAAGSDSAVSRTFFYKVTSPLVIHLAGTGHGTIAGTASVAGDSAPGNGALLNIGENYTVTATPDSHSLFSNWLSSAASAASPAFTFLMQSNLVLTATFASNFYPKFAGAYNGLFYPTNAVSEETSGMLNNLVLLPSGSFTAALLYAGNHYSVSSNFDASGQALFSAGPLHVDLTLDQTNGEVTGTVTTSHGTAGLIADLASNVLPSAQYTILLPPSTNVTAVSPPGDGYILVNDQQGTATLNGALADGSSYNQSVAVSQSGYLPVYAALYTNTATPGLVLGWINLTNLDAAAPANALVWIKKSSRLTTLYTNGFTNILSVQGSLWTNPPASRSAITLTNGQLVLSNTSLFLDFTNVVVNGNDLTNRGVSPTNYLTGSINSRNGLLTLSFVSGTNTKAASGAVLQNTTDAGGFFLTSTNAGSFLLQPQP
jgi:uncharacterized repeat protein (TIGR03803 family)